MNTLVSVHRYDIGKLQKKKNEKKVIFPCDRIFSEKIERKVLNKMKKKV